MKNTLNWFGLLAIFLFAFGSYACGGNANQAKDKQGKEYSSAYICPMHCKGSGSDKAGNCPTCKMAYVANKDAKTTPSANDGHDHSGHNHDGHDHGDHDGHNH